MVRCGMARRCALCFLGFLAACSRASVADVAASGLPGVSRALVVPAVRFLAPAGEACEADATGASGSWSLVRVRGAVVESPGGRDPLTAGGELPALRTWAAAVAARALRCGYTASPEVLLDVDPATPLPVRELAAAMVGAGLAPVRWYAWVDGAGSDAAFATELPAADLPTWRVQPLGGAWTVAPPPQGAIHVVPVGEIAALLVGAPAHGLVLGLPAGTPAGSLLEVIVALGGRALPELRTLDAAAAERPPLPPAVASTGAATLTFGGEVEVVPLTLSAEPERSLHLQAFPGGAMDDPAAIRALTGLPADNGASTADAPPVGTGADGAGGR